MKPLREGDHSILDRAGVFFNQTPNLLIRTCDRDIARRAALIRATTRLRLPDAIIVATALEEHSQVLIGNDAEIARRSVGIPYLYIENYIS